MIDEVERTSGDKKVEFCVILFSEPFVLDKNFFWKNMNKLSGRVLSCCMIPEIQIILLSGMR